MRYYSVNLDIQDRTCLVVGGGNVGTRKVQGLLRSGARVVLVSPELTDELADLVSSGVIRHQCREFTEADLDEAFLVIVATDDMDLNRRVAGAALSKRVLCNVVDRPELCTFAVPAVSVKGDLAVAVSTGGKSPGLARRLRKQFDELLSPAYGPFLDLMGALRTRLKLRGSGFYAEMSKLDALLDSPLLGWIEEKNQEAVETYVSNVMGEALTLDELGVSLDAREPEPWR